MSSTIANTELIAADTTDDAKFEMNADKEYSVSLEINHSKLSLSEKHGHVDELGIDQSDNFAAQDPELCLDPNWWLSEDYNYTSKSGYTLQTSKLIEFEYDPSFIEYGVMI